MAFNNLVRVQYKKFKQKEFKRFSFIAKGRNVKNVSNRSPYAIAITAGTIADDSPPNP